MGLINSENFDATTPTFPTDGWSWDTDYAVAAGAGVGTANGLQYSGNGAQNAWWATADGNSGNVRSSCFIWIPDAFVPYQLDAGPTICVANPVPWSGCTYYCATLEWTTSGTSLVLVRRSAGSQTTLASLTGTTLLDTLHTYWVEVIKDNANLVSARVYRVEDAKWLNSSGAWQSGATTAVSATDGSPLAAGFSGVIAYRASGSGVFNFDAAALNTYDVATTPPTISTTPALLSVQGAGTTITLTYDRPLDATSVPATGDFSHSSKTISAVAVSGSTVVLTVGAAFVFTANPGTLSYTPGTNKVKDRFGNLAGSLSSRTVTAPPPLPSDLRFVLKATIDMGPNVWSPFTRDRTGGITSTTGLTAVINTGGGTEDFTSGVYSRNSASTNEIWYRRNTSVPNPGYNVEVTVNAWTGAAIDQTIIGGAIDSTHYVVARADHSAGTLALVYMNGGAEVSLASLSVTLAAGTKVLFRFLKRWASVWYKRPGDTNYQFFTAKLVSTIAAGFDWTSRANLATWYPVFGTKQSASTAVGVTNFECGHAGCQYVQNNRFVKNDIGAPYLSPDQSKYYITVNGSQEHGTAGDTESAYCLEVFEIDKVAYTATHVSRVWCIQGDEIAGHAAMGATYDTTNSQWVLSTSNFADEWVNANVDVLYGTTTENLFAGVHYINFAALPLPNTVASGAGSPLSVYETDRIKVDNNIYFAYDECATRSTQPFPSHTPCLARATTMAGPWTKYWANTSLTGWEGHQFTQVGGTRWTTCAASTYIATTSVANKGITGGHLNNFTGGSNSDQFAANQVVPPHGCLVPVPNGTGGTLYHLTTMDGTVLQYGTGGGAWTHGLLLIFESNDQWGSPEFSVWPTTAMSSSGLPWLAAYLSN